jgi:soluble lytic murein transglycosylase
VLPRRLSLVLLVLLSAILAGEVAFLYWRERQPRESEFDPIIASVSRSAGVDPFLVRALISRESKFDPNTHGLADERGLMQVTPEVGQMWAKANKVANFQPDDLYDPTTNIRAGTWYLNRALKRWSQTDDPATFALAEYNAGRSNAIRWVDPAAPLDHNAFLERITYSTTHSYVEVILEKRDKYRAALSNDRWYRDFSTNNPSITQTP